MLGLITAHKTEIPCALYGKLSRCYNLVTHIWLSVKWNLCFHFNTLLFLCYVLKLAGAVILYQVIRCSSGKYLCYRNILRYS